MPTNSWAAHLPPRQYARPFKLGAPSMIYGNDVVTNAEILSKSGSGLDFTEIVLFHTPELHNLLSPRQLGALKANKDDTRCIYTVHLPASLEIASHQKDIRERSIRLLVDIWLTTGVLQPAYYILHIPITPPTVVADPHRYFKSKSSQAWDEWTFRALDSLRRIQEKVGETDKLLIENINYSPRFLEPFLESGYCGFCLDVGHLLLGDEPVLEVLEHFRDHIREIHMHGVDKYTEHLSLGVLPENQVLEWFSCLTHWNYRGLINLEVFSPEDLEISLNIISTTVKACSPS